MLKSRKHGMHFSAAMRLTAACLAIALVAPLGAFAKDGDCDREMAAGGNVAARSAR